MLLSQQQEKQLEELEKRQSVAQRQYHEVIQQYLQHMVVSVTVSLPPPPTHHFLTNTHTHTHTHTHTGPGAGD